MERSKVGVKFLQHHGVKGMKWGVRKPRGSRVNTTGKGKQARTHYAKSPSKLTDAELVHRIRRMEAEKRYNELNRRDVSQGQKIATEIITNVGKNVVTSTATAASMFAVKKAIEKKFGPEVKKAMFPKK